MLTVRCINVVTTIFVATAGCTAGSDYAVECRPAPQDTVDDVAQGLTVSGGGDLRDAQLGTIEGSAGTYLVAEIDGPGIDGDGDRAVWWLGERDGTAGPVVAIDHVAQEFSDWGAAAQPGSPMAESRKARMPEAAAVRRACR